MAYQAGALNRSRFLSSMERLGVFQSTCTPPAPKWDASPSKG